MEPLTDKVVDRLTLYHCVLTHTLTDRPFVASQEVAALLKLNDSQVRKDIALCGVLGRQKHGYPTAELKRSIERRLGFADRKNVVIIGAGNLGTALTNYTDFRDYGIDILALFDNHPAKIGRHINGKTVYPMSDLNRFIPNHQVGSVILTVPPAMAQTVAETVMACGVRFIWNFTPCVLRVPPDVVVHYENIIGSFLQMQNGP